MSEDFSAAHWTDGVQALHEGMGNDYGGWNTGTVTTDRGTSAKDASARILDGYAEIQCDYDGPKLRREDGVYAIGSCFAREIEGHLHLQGAHVLSRPGDAFLDPAFKDETGRPRVGYLHRYTPQSMAQDVRRALVGIDGWDEDESLIFAQGEKRIDFDLGWIGKADFEIEGIRARRRAVRALSQGLKTARCVIVTLGLVEAWFHKPTSLWCNKASPGVLRKRAGEFAFCVTPYEMVLAALEEIHALLTAHGVPGVQMVVTVSPVPLQSTFTPRDIVIANTESKATLRAAAGTFVRRHADVHYFPSYEMVMNSHPDKAWFPDRVHVQPHMVKHIVSRFMKSFYVPDEGTATARRDH